MSDSVQVVSSHRAFEGRVFDVRVDEIRVEDDPPHRIDVVEHGGSVAIAAFDDRDRIVLIRQYRHAVGCDVWELPAGSMDDGESARDAAQRELKEETGFTAGSIELLALIYPTPGFCDEIVHLFVARELRAGERALDDDERIHVELISTEDAWRLVTERVSDAKTALTLLWMKAQRDQMRSGGGRS